MISFVNDPDELKGRRALVTGGSRGIGGAIVRHLLSAGAQVVAVARNPVKDFPADAACMVLMKMAHQYLGHPDGIDAGVMEILMDLQYAVLLEPQSCIQHQDILGSDNGKGLYFDQQTAGGALLQVIFFGIEGYEQLALVDRKGPFGQWDDVHLIKLTIKPVYLNTICRSASSRTMIKSMMLNVSRLVPP